MPRLIKITEGDINQAAHGASSSRSAELLRAGLGIVMRTRGSSLTLDYLEDAIDSLVDYFMSSSEAARCKRYFNELYDEQQQPSA